MVFFSPSAENDASPGPGGSDFCLWLLLPVRLQRVCDQLSCPGEGTARAGLVAIPFILCGGFWGGCSSLCAWDTALGARHILKGRTACRNTGFSSSSSSTPDFSILLLPRLLYPPPSLQVSPSSSSPGFSILLPPPPQVSPSSSSPGSSIPPLHSFPSSAIPFILRTVVLWQSFMAELYGSELLLSNPPSTAIVPLCQICFVLPCSTCRTSTTEPTWRGQGCPWTGPSRPCSGPSQCPCSLWVASLGPCWCGPWSITVAGG